LLGNKMAIWGNGVSTFRKQKKVSRMKRKSAVGRGTEGNTGEISRNKNLKRDKKRKQKKKTEIWAKGSTNSNQGYGLLGYWWVKGPNKNIGRARGARVRKGKDKRLGFGTWHFE